MDPDADFARALAAHRAGDLETAERGYREILAASDHLPSLKHLALVFEKRGQVDEALSCHRRAADLAPNDPGILFKFALYLRLTRQFPAAESVLRRLLSLVPDYPDAHIGLANALIATGRFAEGWAAYENRSIRRRLLDGLALPEWRGEPLAGKRLLVWREEGFGDQIMMARFLPALAEADVTYGGPAALHRLFAHLPARFVEDEPTAIDLDAYDYWILPMSLPSRLGVSEETLPTAPYLFGRPARSGGVGVVWQGESRNMNNRFRSLPAAAAERLLALPGAVSLEPSSTGAADFQDTADILAGLDLVITVDTSLAHLAGAMGLPVVVLLARYALDWHWPRQGASAWYPSARLFVQSEHGAWDAVVDAACAEARRVRPT